MPDIMAAVETFLRQGGVIELRLREQGPTGEVVVVVPSTLLAIPGAAPTQQAAEQVVAIVA